MYERIIMSFYKIKLHLLIFVYIEKKKKKKYEKRIMMLYYNYIINRIQINHLLS